MKRHSYTFLQWTWGLPQSLAGAFLYFLHRKDTHFDYRGARATAWNKSTGISLGKFIFVPKRAGNLPYEDDAYHNNGSNHSDRSTHNIKSNHDRNSGHKSEPESLLEHEYGHTIQSLILGPFYLLLVGIPSILWSRLPYFRRKRKRSGTSYYSVPFESSANYLTSRNKNK